MKIEFPVSCFVIGCGSLLVASSIHAAKETVYWDGNDTTANADGGAGIWGGAVTNWDDAASGGHSVAWDGNANVDDTATFAGTVDTVTLGADVTVSDLSFNTTGYFLSATTNHRMPSAGRSGCIPAERCPPRDGCEVGMVACAVKSGVPPVLRIPVLLPQLSLVLNPPRQKRP